MTELGLNQEETWDSGGKVHFLPFLTGKRVWKRMYWFSGLKAPVPNSPLDVMLVHYRLSVTASFFSSVTFWIMHVCSSGLGCSKPAKLTKHLVHVRILVVLYLFSEVFCLDCLPFSLKSE